MLQVILPALANVLPGIAAVFAAQNVYNNVVGSVVETAVAMVNAENQRNLIMRVIMFIPSLPFRFAYQGIRRLVGARPNNNNSILEVVNVNGSYQITTGPEFQTLVISSCVKVVLFGVLLYTLYITIKFMFVVTKHSYQSFENAQLLDRYRKTGTLPSRSNPNYHERF